jgi:hypothetical protein
MFVLRKTRRGVESPVIRHWLAPGLFGVCPYPIVKVSGRFRPEFRLGRAVRFAAGEHGIEYVHTPPRQA